MSECRVLASDAVLNIALPPDIASYSSVFTSLTDKTLQQNDQILTKLHVWEFFTTTGDSCPLCMEKRSATVDQEA